MTASKRNLASLTAAAALALAAAPAAASACPDGHVQAAVLSEDQFEESVTCLINERRTSSGRKPVRGNSRLRHAAVDHASHMVSVGFFSHTAPNGRSFVDRIESSGYMRGARSWLVGENLVWASGERSTPERLVQAWMESPAHRKNLLRGRFREVGVGVRRGTPYNAGEQNGVTVTSEYGFRTRSRRGRAAGRKHRRR
ncbi:MAG: CAP domain-containing protein [Solirubrobacterales bacterium]